MKRWAPVGALLIPIAFMAGYVAGPGFRVKAQDGGGPSQTLGMALGPASARLHDGKAYVIKADEVFARFPPADKTGNVPNPDEPRNLGWDPTFTLLLMRAPYFDPGMKGRNTGMLMHWDQAEMHEQKAHLYVIMRGTGQVALGGDPHSDHKPPIINGQHGSDQLGPAQGATMTTIKPGDFIVIPPYAWHQLRADPGQTITYLKVDILTPRLMLQ